jgi:hypothetical protein
VSDNLELIDFDSGELLGGSCELVEAQCPGLVARLNVVETPREPAGYHVRYRCPEVEIPGNTKLAMKPGVNAKTGKPERIVLIETRGEGGQGLAPGGNPKAHPSGRPYTHHSGPPLTSLPKITAAEREVLLATARSFDLCAAPAPKERASTGQGNAGPSGLRPGEDFDLRGPPIEELLEPHGWQMAYRRGDVLYLRRPGKDGGGISATFGYCKGPNGEPLLHVFTSNGHPFEMGKTYGRFGVYMILNHGGDTRAAWNAAVKDVAGQGYGEQWSHSEIGHEGVNGEQQEGEQTDGPTPAGDGADGSGANGGRPDIVVCMDEHMTNDEAVFALARDPSLYQRAGQLVRVMRDDSPAARGIRRPYGPRIEAIPEATLRERLTAAGRWVKLVIVKGKEKKVRVHPPKWAIAAVSNRADWPKVRHLEAVIEYPALRPDGTLLLTPGYDAATGLLLEPKGELPAIPESPRKDQAIAARDALFEVVCDFPLQKPAHKASWLAAVLTPLARFAFAGPAPLFLVEASCRGAGKGLLLNCSSQIIRGDNFTVATYTQDEDELRKPITALALAGDRLVLFDNLDGKFGNATLDAALTTTSWKDRLLGVNRVIEAPLYMTWFATGNNVAVGADTSRRICPIRLETEFERPEERKGFRFPNLIEYVNENRDRLLGAALTILRAFCVAGRPDQDLPPWGSFEGWSALVRGAVVWVGMPDPAEARVQLQEQSDTTAESMSMLLENWEKMDPERSGLTTAELIGTLYEKGTHAPPAWHAEMRAAIDGLVGRGDATRLGYKLRSFRRRIFTGRYIDHAGSERRAIRWAAYPASTFRPDRPSSPAAREDDEDGEDTAPNAHAGAEVSADVNTDSEFF